MSQVEVEQQSYQMPPKDGFTVAHFLTVADVERSLRFYETVFEGRILSRGDNSGAPGYIQIANTWLLVNPGGGPTPDKPSVTLAVPADPDAVSMHQRPGIVHYLFDYSPDMEYLEIVSPADFKTVDMPPATDAVPPVTPWK